MCSAQNFSWRFRPSNLRPVLVHRGYRYRVYPTAVQEMRLTAWSHALRWLWNLALEQRFMAHTRRCKVDARYPTAFDQINELTDLRAEAPWLSDVPRNVCAQVLVELDRTWQRCFKRISRAPHWKRKGRDRVTLCEPHPKAFLVGTNSIMFPKLGPMRAVIHRPLGGKPKTCSLVRDGDAWFAIVMCEVELPDALPSTKSVVGVDRGVVNLLADSDGRLVPNPRNFEKTQDRVARAQRVISRRKKGSKNREKARLKIARLLRKARWQRDAVLHRESTHYAKNHGTVFVERLNLRGMTASAKGTSDEPGMNVRAKAGLNRSLRHAALGRFVEMLRYKAVPEGGQVLEVPAAYSSQECSTCGHIDARNRVSQSEFVCVSCGHRDHADVNASKVILSRGTHGGAVCGGRAVGQPVKQKLRVARRGTRHREPEAEAPALMPD